MAIKTITVSGKQVTFKASAGLPRFYRARCGRELLQDFDALIGKLGDKTGEEGVRISELDGQTLTMFEDIAHTMAKYADDSVPDDPGEWLDQFDVFSIYEIMPQLMELWGINIKSTAIPKKKQRQATAR